MWFVNCTFFIGLRRQKVCKVFTGKDRLRDVDGTEGTSLCLSWPSLGSMFFFLSFPGEGKWRVLIPDRLRRDSVQNNSRKFLGYWLEPYKIAVFINLKQLNTSNSYSSTSFITKAGEKKLNIYESPPNCNIYSLIFLLLALLSSESLQSLQWWKSAWDDL